MASEQVCGQTAKERLKRSGHLCRRLPNAWDSETGMQTNNPITPLNQLNWPRALGQHGVKAITESAVPWTEVAISFRPSVCWPIASQTTSPTLGAACSTARQRFRGLFDHGHRSRAT